MQLHIRIQSEHTEQTISSGKKKSFKKFLLKLNDKNVE
jgi:hypothetical protein